MSNDKHVLKNKFQMGKTAFKIQMKNSKQYSSLTD